MEKEQCYWCGEVMDAGSAVLHKVDCSLGDVLYSSTTYHICPSCASKFSCKTNPMVNPYNIVLPEVVKCGD